MTPIERLTLTPNLTRNLDRSPTINLGPVQDFGNDTARPGIDYAGMHLWPDNWLEVRLTSSRVWGQDLCNGRSIVLKPSVKPSTRNGVGPVSNIYSRLCRKRRVR